MNSKSKGTIAAVSALAGILVFTQGPALARRGGERHRLHRVDRPP